MSVSQIYSTFADLNISIDIWALAFVGAVIFRTLRFCCIVASAVSGFAGHVDGSFGALATTDGMSAVVSTLAVEFLLVHLGGRGWGSD